MAKLTISARFDSLHQAEGAATEVRSLFSTEVDIRALSENQSDNSEQSPLVPGIIAFPNMNFNSSTPYVAAFPAGQSGVDDEGGTYSKHAYVMETMVESEREQEIAEIIERYDGELV